LLFKALELLLVLFYEFRDHGGIDVERDVLVGVILHDLEDEDLVVLEGLSIAVDQESEEVEQFRLVETAFGFTVDRVADFLDQFAHIDLVEEKGFVVVVHLLQEIDAAHVFADMVLDRGKVANQSRLDVLVVPDQTHQELVTEVQKLQGVGLLWRDLGAIEDEL
jgi:hypothetical protein